MIIIAILLVLGVLAGISMGVLRFITTYIHYIPWANDVINFCVLGLCIEALGYNVYMWYSWCYNKYLQKKSERQRIKDTTMWYKLKEYGGSI
jgi:hypothetical protein